MKHSVTHLKIKALAFLFLIDTLSIFKLKAHALLFKLDTLSVQTQASSLGLLITFVNNFQLNLVLMFVINLI
jgi:hypothetical protein